MLNWTDGWALFCLMGWLRPSIFPHRVPHDAATQHESLRRHPKKTQHEGLPIEEETTRNNEAARVSGRPAACSGAATSGECAMAASCACFRVWRGRKLPRAVQTCATSSRPRRPAIEPVKTEEELWIGMEKCKV